MYWGPHSTNASILNYSGGLHNTGTNRYCSIQFARVDRYSSRYTTSTYLFCINICRNRKIILVYHTRLKQISTLAIKMWILTYDKIKDNILLIWLKSALKPQSITIPYRFLLYTTLQVPPVTINIFILKNSTYAPPDRSIHVQLNMSKILPIIEFA